MKYVWHIWNWSLPTWVPLSNGEPWPNAMDWVRKVKTITNPDWQIVIETDDFVAAIHQPSTHLLLLVRKEA